MLCCKFVIFYNYFCEIYGNMYDSVIQKLFPCRVVLPLVAACFIKCQCGILISIVVFFVKHVANIIHYIE